MENNIEQALSIQKLQMEEKEKVTLENILMEQNENQKDFKTTKEKLEKQFK